MMGFERGADGPDPWNSLAPGGSRGPLELDPRAEALAQQFQAVKAQIEARSAQPLWNPDNPVGTETVQSVGMPGPTTYAGPVGQFIDPATGRMTTQGAERLDNPALGFDTGGIGGVMTMYHGSPHKFPPTARNPLGEFDPAKIGTGEGAQAYGVGAGYLAEAEGLAKHYRDVLTREKGRGHYWQDASGKEVNIDALRNLPEGHPDSMAANMLNQRASVDEAIADVTKYGPSAFAGGKPEMDAALKGLQAMKERGLERVVDKGHMYEVRVHADPEQFLHWDKPLSEQHPDVQKAVRASIGNAQPVQLRDGRYSITHVQPDGSGRVLWDIAEASPEAAREMYSQWLSSSSGREIYQHLARGLETTPGNESAAASQALQKAGIPGIRYLDQGSRGAGEGSHNAVVFDANSMEIIRRYGLAGLMAGAAGYGTASSGGSSDGGP
jgi:hypothetical protein